MSDTLVPTQSHILFGGAVEVHCFGTRYGDWSLRGANPEEAEKSNPGILTRLMALSYEYGCTFHAPNPGMFNGRVVELEELKEAWIPRVLYRGTLADGAVLRHPDQAFAVASADCPTAVLYRPDTGAVVAAHAGRDSLWQNESNGRRHLITGMLNRLDAFDERVRGFIACGICPSHFLHSPRDPVHGERNRQMLEAFASYALSFPSRAVGASSGHLRLAEAIREQLYCFGVPLDNVGYDGSCTYGDQGPDGEPLWHSHRRDHGGKRNLVLVIRRR